MKRLLRKLILFSGVAVALLFLILGASEWWISSQSLDSLYPQSASLPANKVGLVLGCSLTCVPEDRTFFTNTVWKRQ